MIISNGTKSVAAEWFQLKADAVAGQLRTRLLGYAVGMCLAINTQSDRCGWLNGLYETADGEQVHVDIMPPTHAWAGDVRLPGFEPHKTDWVVYIDGEEADRVRAWDDIEQAIRRAIS